jgi:hypothetical protein
MTIEQLREKIAYRTNKMNWCISVGRETQAEWNRDQIARLEESIQAIEAQQDQEAIDQRLIERNINRGRGNDVQSFNPCVEIPIQPNVRNRPARNTDEDFDYV